MASADKTEKATPRRREMSRKEGQVTKSVDLNSGILLAVSFALLFMLGSGLFDSFKEITITNLSTLDTTELTLTGIIPFLTNYLLKISLLIAPLLVGLVIVGVIVNIAQVGPLFSAKIISPNISKVNPINGFKRIFSLRGLMELLKGILKLVIVGGIAFWTIYADKSQIFVLGNSDIPTAEIVIYNLIFNICLRICIILLILGIIDYIYQKYEFEKSIRMTKQEIKDEYKNMEGNPQIKSKIKSIQIQMAQSRMMSKVKDADVVVTNPTHFAVALKYDPSVAPAPYVIAKGADFVAKRIKDLARENKVPIIENKPLARSLFKLAELNKMVPEELFMAVAEILAYVYKKNKKKQKKIKAKK